MGPWSTTRRQANSTYHGIVRWRKQGVRTPISVRRARGRVGPPRHLGGETASRRCRHPRLLHPSGRRHPGCGGGITLALRRRRRHRVCVAAEGSCEFEGTRYVLELSIRTDFALVHARYGDRHGNLIYEESAANFNPLCAAAGRLTIAEVEELA